MSDPAFLDYFGLSGSISGVTVSEATVLGLSAVFRAVSLIAGTIASLPLKTYRLNDGTKERVASFLDNPAGIDSDITAFEWKETCMVSLLLHGNAYFLKVRNAAGALAGLEYLHPSVVSVTRENGRKVFRIAGHALTSAEVLHIPALSTDGLVGKGPLQVGRDSFGITIAGERAAGKAFRDGALISGMVTPEEDLTEEDAKDIKESLQAKVSGLGNAGDIAVINRKLKFSPWTLSARDAQFMESREFQVIEIARWFGLPPHLLGETQRQTSWGSGVQEQNHGLARFTLQPWTERIESRLSQLLPAPRFCEFDYSGLLQPTPAEEINLLMAQVTQGFLTLNEARRIRNLPPLEGGDTLRLPPGAAPAVPAESTSDDTGEDGNASL